MWWSLLPLFLVFDLQGLLALWRRWVLDPTEESTTDYTVIIPLYGDPRHLRNLDFLATIRDRVLIAIDVGVDSMRALAADLAAAGWRVAEVEVGPRVGMEAIVHAVLRTDAVTTKWVVRMDADTVARDDLGTAVAAADRAGADICSVKCLVADPRNVLEKIQALEYAMAMRSRHYRPWMTSGACTLATVDAFRTILSRHTLDFATSGGDIESGQIAHHLRMKIRHVDFAVFTEVPATLRQLFRQRLLWWGAAFRMTVLNLDSTLRMPGYLLYYLALIWAGVYWKVGGAFDVGHMAEYLPTLLLLYTAIGFITNWPVRDPWMIVFPYYSILQATVMPVCGACWCVGHLLRHRRSPRFKFGFRRGRYPAPA
jgi:cellulose synthase/poly-beta-1,6-N-acetylglucosamine synthase-like glycosyltransferase